MKNEIIIFENQDIKLEVNMKDETVWLNANQMAELFGRNPKTIRKHINNVLNEELKNELVVAKFATTSKHGAINNKNQEHMVDYYNLKDKITYEGCLNIIKQLKFNEESSIFALERNKGLASIIDNIYQTFDKKDVYSTIEEKSANFLYLIVKNHVFNDGNKRIAATLFIYFLSFFCIKITIFYHYLHIKRKKIKKISTHILTMLNHNIIMYLALLN